MGLVADDLETPNHDVTEVTDRHDVLGAAGHAADVDHGTFARSGSERDGPASDAAPRTERDPLRIPPLVDEHRVTRLECGIEPPLDRTEGRGLRSIRQIVTTHGDVERGEDLSRLEPLERRR
jgi:hypothetical protein